MWQVMRLIMFLVMWQIKWLASVGSKAVITNLNRREASVFTQQNAKAIVKLLFCRK
jgi:hypothetical protein